MAFEVINNSEIQVGKSIKADLFRKIKVDLDDLNSRTSSLEIGGRKIEVWNCDVLIGSFGATVTGISHHEALQDMNLVECSVQIYEKGSLTGTLSIDVKKNTTPNNTGMTSVFTILPTIVLASSSDYQRNTGTFNGANQSIVKGEILRLDVTSLPVGMGKFRVVLIGEV